MSDGVNNIDERIAKAQNEVNKLKREKEVYDASLFGEEYKLAEIAHDILCHSNHADGCGWFYYGWDKMSKDDTYCVRNRYLKMAKSILKITNYENALKILEAIKNK